MTRLQAFVLAVSLLVVVVMVSQHQSEASPACGKNAGIVECGTHCPESCTNKPKVCNFACFKGCRCHEGFIFKEGDTGDCITRAEC